MSEMLQAEFVARQFHETYERLAPSFGYVTRAESRTSWSRLPEHNRELMIATARDLLDEGVIRVGGPSASNPRTSPSAEGPSAPFAEDSE